MKKSVIKLSNLNQFIGTTAYYLIGRRHLLTDGTKYLADQASCYWMMDAILSHLPEIGGCNYFIVVKVEAKDLNAVMIYSDGNNIELARQEIPYTDLLVSNIKLYACFSDEYWTIMLPSEY